MMVTTILKCCLLVWWPVPRKYAMVFDTAPP